VAEGTLSSVAPTLDYERHGRQIALPELGAEGQCLLATTPVDLSTLPPEAADLHVRAGGSLATAGLPRGTPAVTLPAGPILTPGPVTVGVSAWAAVEAARRVLGQSSAPIPPALLARLGAR